MDRPPTTDDERTERLGQPDEPETIALGRTRARRFGAAAEVVRPRPGTRAPRGPDSTRPLGARRESPIRGDRLVLDRYRLERRLGAGGFGVVWLAFDEKLEREVAVKVVERGGDGPVPARATREARVAARLNHPGIVSLYELGEDDDAVYLVSELVHGRTLAELEAAGAVSDRDVARIGVALCDALAHAHRREVIHRDVKPGNVIVAAEPAAGAGFAKLADFGVAHLGVADPLTITGDVVGTLAYMAPEQAEGARVTSAADVYALALTLYEAWTGANPVRGPSPAATARRVGRPLPSLAAYRSDLPDDLCGWVDAALDPVAERRPALGRLREALADASPALGDRGGLVEPETLERVGIARTTTERRRRRTAAVIEPPSGPVWDLATRVAAGAGAGALALAAMHGLGPSPRFSTVAAAAAVAIAVALLPRIAWLTAAGALVFWLGWELRDGTALVVGAALAVVPVMLPRAGRAWSVPALAPLLGAVALAPLYVGLAGFASTAWRRAGLAIAGFVWLVTAEVLASQRLLFGRPPDALPRGDWSSSVGGAFHHALAPLASSRVIAGAAVWAVFAIALPILVRGRTLALDALGAALWAGGLIAAHEFVARAASGHVHTGQARGAAVGAILAAFAAVAARETGLWRSPRSIDPVP